MPDVVVQLVIPIAAVIGIIFSLLQWYLVSRVKLFGERDRGVGAESKNGLNVYLVDEEDGLDDQSVVNKCAEIQTAISEGLVTRLIFSLFFFLFFKKACMSLPISVVMFSFSILISFLVF